jgi:hypothetical protein
MMMMMMMMMMSTGIQVTLPTACYSHGWEPQLSGVQKKMPLPRLVGPAPRQDSSERFPPLMCRHTELSGNERRRRCRKDSCNGSMHKTTVRFDATMMVSIIHTRKTMQWLGHSSFHSVLMLHHHVLTL